VAAGSRTSAPAFAAGRDHTGAGAGSLAFELLYDDATNNSEKLAEDKSQILRNGVVVIDGAEFKDAIYKGRTLDQLNVQAGDEIRIAVKPAGGLFWRVVGAVTGLSGLIYLFITISRG